MISGEWLTVQDVAGLLQVRIETVRRWIRRGDLPVLELGGPRTVYRINRADLEQFVWKRYRTSGETGEVESVDLAVRTNAEPASGDDQTDTFGRAVKSKSDAHNAFELGGSISSPRSFLDHMPAVTFREQTLVKGSISFMSSEVEAMLGYSPDEFSSDPGFWDKYVHPDDVRSVREELARTDASGDPFRMEYRMLRRDGQTIWVRVEAELVEDEHEAPVWEGVIVNVTERRRLEAALRLRERQQFAIADLGRHALDGDSMTSLFDAAARHVAEALDVELSLLYEVLPGGSSVVTRARSGVSADQSDNGVDALSAVALNAREPVICADLTLETRFNGKGVAQQFDVCSGVAVPIPGRGRSFGVLVVYSKRPRMFTDEDVSFLQSIAHVLAATAMRTNDQWLTVLEVAEFLQVTEETVRRWIRRAELPALNLGGARAGYRVYPSDLERFIQDRLIRL